MAALGAATRPRRGVHPPLNQILAFCPVDPSEVELRQRFARAGIGAGLPFNPAALSPVQRQALAAGIQQGVEELKAKGATLRSSAGLFGTRAAVPSTLADQWGARCFFQTNRGQFEVLVEELLSNILHAAMTSMAVVKHRWTISL